MSERTHGQMPRAFLVKNKSRRSATTVDGKSETDMSDRDFRPGQLGNSEGMCSVTEHDHEQYRRTTIDLTQSDVRYDYSGQGS